MWRIINLMLVGCCIASSAWAQRITGAEYFFNQDPGVGAGIPATVQGEGTVRLEASIDVAGIPEGFNSLFFRFKNDQGIWGLAEGRMLYIERIPVPIAKNIAGAEYFFDHDPGVGHGNAVSVGNDGTLVGEVSVNGMDEGFHRLYYRFKDNFGFWSLAEGRQVYVEKIPIPTNRYAIGAEYYFDTDPGAGNGLAVAVDPSGIIQGEVETVGLEEGFHQLYVRVQDDRGLWGLAEGRMFFIEKLPKLVEKKIARAEYFFDKDPGIGKAKEVVPDAGGRILKEFSTDDMSEGFHKLFVRYQDDAGNWGQAEGRSFLVYAFQGTSLELDATGKAMLLEPHVLKSGDHTFPYGSVSFGRSQFDCTAKGENKVKITATDPHGEKVETEVMVTVYDHVAPVVKTRDFVLKLNEDGMATLSPTDLDAGSSDNCGIASMEISRQEFSCSDLGTHIVQFKAKDHSGNESMAEVTVTVVDQMAPRIEVKPTIQVRLDEEGLGELTVDEVDGGSTDNCGIVERTLSRTTFNIDDAGETSITYSIKDASGNTTSRTINVMVDVILAIGSREVGEDNEVKLYPNPTNNLINIAYEKIVDDQLKAVEIVDVNGRVILEITDFDRSQHTITVDVQRFRAGTYMVRLISNRNIQVLRFKVSK